jgi:hypothetical protein
MTGQHADIDGAIAALSHAVASMEERHRELEQQLADFRAERTAKLDDEVSQLLPSISTSVLESLEQVEQTFVDETVRQSFAEHSSLLDHVLHRGAYGAALTLLQTRLKRHLERRGLVAAIDREIAVLESQRAVLGTQVTEALATLKLFQRAQRSKAPIPKEVIRGVNSIADRGRALRKAGSAPAAREPAWSRGSSDSSPSSDSDLWLWMMTDVPTSFRTLMLESFAYHHSDSGLRPGGGEFSGAGAQGDWSDTPSVSQDASAQSSERNDDNAAAAGLVGAFESGGSQAMSPPGDTSQPIATDDSLGRFS